LAPAIAAYARLSFIKLLADRTPLAELPSWIFTYGKLGLIEVCGRAEPMRQPLHRRVRHCPTRALCCVCKTFHSAPT